MIILIDNLSESSRADSKCVQDSLVDSRPRLERVDRSVSNAFIKIKLGPHFLDTCKCH